MARIALARADFRTLHVAHRFAARADDVYGAWLHPALVRHWLFATAGRPLLAACIDPWPGGDLVLRDRAPGREVVWRGTFTRLAPTAALAFTLALPDVPDIRTRVEVHIARATPGCRLTLAHAGVPAACAAAMEARWQGALYGLGETLSAWDGARADGMPVGAG